MQIYDEMKAYVGFNHDDSARLAKLAKVAEPHIHAVIEHFYDRIEVFPDAAAVLEGPEQIERLKGTLRQWLRELLTGPHDDAYYQRRKKIGHVHVRVGLPSRFMFTAMSVIRDDLCDIVEREYEGMEAHRLCRAIFRATELDLAIMTGTYISRREQKQLAALQELLVAHLPVTVLLIDADGLVVAATAPMHRVAAIAGNPVGQHYLDVVPAELCESAQLVHHIARAVDTNREIELPRVDTVLDEQERNLSVTIVPLANEQAQALLYFEDLTDTVQAEANLRRAENLAQLGALSAAVAHELRNPLAGMSGALQLIGRSFDEGDPRSGIVIKVNEQIGRLNEHITELLEFARTPRLEPRLVSLEDIAVAVKELAASEFEDVAVQVLGRGRAWADSHAVHRILLNLVINAAQAQEGTGRVRITLKNGLVRVEDEGPGVPEEARARIFQPFFTTKIRGTGLGLATAHRTVSDMGGALVIAEGELSGACFEIRLQIREPGT